MNKKTRQLKTKKSAEYLLSEKGLEALKDKLESLHAKRKEQVMTLATLREQQSDDVSVEDASFIYAMGMIEAADAEIERIGHILNHAEVVTDKSRKPNEVTLGSHVTLEGDGQSYSYTIVHSLEADPLSGKISIESPLGRQLLGRRLWDKITFRHSQRYKPLSLKLIHIA